MSSKQRYYAYDFIRAVATLMVVAIHALGGPGPSLAARWYDAVIRFSMLLCNALFFMLSGRLNLRVHSDNELPTYYYRKFTRVLLPTLVYILFQSAYEQIFYQGVALGEGRIIRAFILNSIGDYAGGVHWFIMSLFGMLLAAPIIAPAFRSITPGRKKAFVILFLLFTIPPIFLCRTSHSFGWKYELTTFFGIFIYGSIMDLDRLSSLPKWKVTVPTLTCIAISSTLLFLGFPHHPVNDNTPMYYLASVGLFVLLYRLGKNLKPNSRVCLLAKHSFGIYLCHVPFLLLITPYFSWAPMPLRHWFITASTLVVALIFAILVDTAIVNPLQRFSDSFWSKRSKALA